MVNTKQTKVAKDDQILKGLLSNVENVEVKKNLNDTELLELVYENLKATKSAQLKFLRSEGYKVSQSRCYTTYVKITEAMKPTEKVK